MSKRKNWLTMDLAPTSIGPMRLLAKGDLGRPPKMHYGFFVAREFAEYELLDKLEDVLDGPNGLVQRVLGKLQELSERDDDRHGELLRDIIPVIHFIKEFKAKDTDADWLVYKLGRLVERAGLEDEKLLTRSKGGSAPKYRRGIMTWVRQEVDRTPEASVHAIYKRLAEESEPTEVKTDDGVFDVYRYSQGENAEDSAAKLKAGLVFEQTEKTGIERSIKYNTFRDYVAERKRTVQPSRTNLFARLLTTN